MKTLRPVLAATVLAMAGSLFALAPAAWAHRPDQPVHQFADLPEFQFEGGGSLPKLRMSYITYGKLDAARSNAILLQHGFASNHHGFDHWIGPGQALDTDKYFIIVPDALGATQANYAHSSSATSSGLKMKFPFYNGRDMVRAQYRLVTEVLGIRQLLAIGGISSGADHSLQFAISYPDFMDGVIPIVGGALWGSQGFFFGPQLIAAIESCDGWRRGEYDTNPANCATNALSALVPYFYTRDWWDRNIDSPEAYTRWRTSLGSWYLDVQDARDLYYRAMAWGRGWVGDSPGFNGDVNAALRSIRAKTLFIYSPVDQLHMPHHVETQVKAIPRARAVAVESIAGHLICCNADPSATHRMGQAMTEFLSGLGSTRSSAKGQ